MPDRWAPLAAPFPAEAPRWRVVEMDSVEHRALVAPELDPVAITSRLDEVLGREGWSQRFQAPSPEAIICELEIAGVCKAAVVARRTPGDDAEHLGAAALAQAAERFGLRPPTEPSVCYWVDADPESGQPLHDPPGDASVQRPTSTAEPAAPAKPEGQLAIDRLVERLREEGHGLEAARVLITYGGYGHDPETARDLYAKLRSMLLEQGKADSVEAL